MNKYLIGSLLASSVSMILVGQSFANGEAKIIIDQENKKILIQSGDQNIDVNSFSGNMVLPLKLPTIGNPTIPEKTQTSTPSTPAPQVKNQPKTQPEEEHIDKDLEAELPSGTELEKAIFRMHKNDLTSFATLEGYRPEQPLLRGEVAKIVTEAYTKLGYPQEIKNTNCTYSDSSEFNASLSEYIKKGCQYGIFIGGKGNFYSYRPITKAELLAVLIRIIENQKSNENFSPRWTIYFIKGKEISLTNERNPFSLSKPITRGEAALLIYRFKNLVLNQKLFSIAKKQIENINQNPTSFLQSQLSGAQDISKENQKTDNNSISSPILNLLSGSRDSSSSLSILNNPEITEAMHRMRESGLTSATDIATYRAFDLLTREQAAKMLAEFAKIEGFLSISGGEKNCIFDDLNSANITLHNSILELCKLGLIKGGNGHFKPKNNIGKIDLLTLLIRLSEGKYLDERKQPRWTDYFLKARELGLINNDDILSIETPITRYEAALIFYRFWIKHKILSNLNTTQLKNELITTIKNNNGSFLMINDKHHAVSIDSNLLKNQFFQEGFIEILGQRYRLKKTNITTFDIGNESFVWYGDLFEISSEIKVGNLNFIVSNSNIIDGSLRLIHQAKNWKIKPDTTTTARYQLIKQ